MSLPELPGLDWHPSLPLPVLMALAAVAGLAALVFIPLARNLRGWAKPPVLLLRLAAIAALVVIALNPVATDKVPDPRRSAALLLDTSTSMALGGRMAEARGFARDSARAFGAGTLHAFHFGERTGPLDPAKPAPAPSGRATRLGDAIRRALDTRPPPASLLVIGDGGCDDRRELDAAARLAKARGVPIHVRPVGGADPLPNAWLAGIRVPRQARPQSTVPVQVWVESRGIDRPLALRLVNHEGSTLASARIVPSEDSAPHTLEIQSGLRPETFRLILEQPENDIIADDNEMSFRLDVSSPSIRVLYMEGTHISHPVATAAREAVWNTMELKTRAWDATGEIDTVILSPITQFANNRNLLHVRRFLGGGIEFDSSGGFPESRDELFKYDVIIIGDVPRGNFTEEQMEWVVELVTRRGGGFCMIGGYTSFDSGDFDRTPWEKITPVDMVEYGHGYSNSTTELLIPAAAREHPIWRIVPDPLENARILDSHPLFHGFHDIRRAKPGAVNLGLHADGRGPLITVQSYGRGRSMAFLSDTNGGWAGDYIHWGAEATGATIGNRKELGHGPQILHSTDGMTAEDAVPHAMTHPSPYFGQFWVNTVRWLAGNSLRRLGEGLSGHAADSVARPGATLDVSAEVTAGIPPEEMSGLSVTARLLLPGAGTARLKWQAGRREFTGSIEIPADVPSRIVPIVFECEANGRTLSDRVDLPVLALNPEIERVDASPGLLRDLAASTGGREVATPAEAADALRQDIDRSAEAELVLLRPAWDRPLWWSVLLAILAAEWLVRKLAGRRAPR